MAVNLDKPHLWRQDTKSSVDCYNKWFMRFAPVAFRETRVEVTKQVEQAILDADDLRGLSPGLLRSRPGILPTLRMSCCPPLAVDRLVGLAGVDKNLAKKMELGELPEKMGAAALTLQLQRITEVVSTLLDREILVWIRGGRAPTTTERYRASAIVAGRMYRTVANDRLRGAWSNHQLSALRAYLGSRGYREFLGLGRTQYERAKPGTYRLFVKMPAAMGENSAICVDALVQPIARRPDRPPVLIKAESHVSFEQARKRKSVHLASALGLRMTYGDGAPLVLLLGGYCDGDYLGTQAAGGIDWVWQHRVADIQAAGV
jgi:type II restriction enzyme